MDLDKPIYLRPSLKFKSFWDSLPYQYVKEYRHAETEGAVYPIVVDYVAVVNQLRGEIIKNETE